MNPNSNYDENDSDNNSELSETEERNLESIISIFPKRDLRKEVENADKSTFEKIKQLLSCPICLEIFKEPVFVKECMHRFCKGCIEKIIRGNHKNCPTCRKSIGSKRELKPDNAAVEMIVAIFTNLKEYLEKENEHELAILQKTFKDGFLRSSTKKKGARKQALDPAYSEMDEESELTELKKTIKRQKKATKKESTLQKSGEASQRIKVEEEEMDEEKNEEENWNEEELLQLLKNSTIEELFKKTEFLLTVKFEPLPSSWYLPTIERNVIKASSIIKIEHLYSHVCNELHFKESKYKERISLYINTGDYVKVDEKRSLRDLLNNEWKDNRSNGVTTYDLEAFVKEILDKSYLKEDTTRILYYDFVFDDLLGA